MEISLNGVESTTVYKQLAEGAYESVILDWTGDYPDPYAFLSLYHTLIRSRLEYCSFVWSPKDRTMCDMIERVQRKFVKFISFKCKLSTDLSYQEKYQYFKLQTLESRREMFDLRMLNKVLCNKVDCPDLLNGIGFCVPTRHTTVDAKIYLYLIIV